MVGRLLNGQRDDWVLATKLGNPMTSQPNFGHYSRSWIVRETENSLELRTRDRYRKLINKIDQALNRIEEGEYGYCEKTGDPIGLRRLIARPVATMTVEAQEAHERREKVSRDD